MSLADDLAEAAKANPCAGRCKFCAWVGTLDAKDAAAVVDALNGPAMGSALAAALARHGSPANQQTVQRHRRGDCKQWNLERTS